MNCFEEIVVNSRQFQLRPTVESLYRCDCLLDCTSSQQRNQFARKRDNMKSRRINSRLVSSLVIVLVLLYTISIPRTVAAQGKLFPLSFCDLRITATGLSHGIYKLYDVSLYELLD